MQEKVCLGNQVLPSSVDEGWLAGMIRGGGEIVGGLGERLSLPQDVVLDSNRATFRRTAPGSGRDELTGSQSVPMLGNTLVSDNLATGDLATGDLEASFRPVPFVENPVTTTAIALGGSEATRPVPLVEVPLTNPTSEGGTNPAPIVVELNPGLLVTSQPSPIPIPNPFQPLPTPPPPPLVQFTNLVFSGNEGTTGTVQLQWGFTQAPPTPLTLTLNAGNFLVVDADNNALNGTQTTITLNATNWNVPQTISFIAEVDGVASDRLTGNTIAYTLSGSSTSSSSTETGSFNLGTVRNTYAPDTTRFNLDLDFRNDTTGFWTTARQAIAQRAANDWATLIANEWTGFQLNNSLSKIGNDGNYTPNTFAVERYVDDLVVFVNTINTNGTAGGFGAVEYDIGGWLTSPQLQTRVGQIAIDPAVGDLFLYNTVLHELGHTLGLVGLNWDGFLQQNLASPQTATFNGLYSTAANGGLPVPLQSQDGANPVTGTFDYWHPANRIESAMSYGYLYTVTGPTAMDKALLADSGYLVYGVNTPLPPPLPAPLTTVPLTTEPSPLLAVARPELAGVNLG